MYVVLPAKLLLLCSTAAVHRRVAPAVQDLAAPAGAPASSAGGLGGRGAVVDHVDLGELAAAEHDLVEAGERKTKKTEVSHEALIKYLITAQRRRERQQSARNVARSNVDHALGHAGG